MSTQAPVEEAQSILRTYVNDMIAVERDVHNAIHGQTEDQRVQALPQVQALLREIASGSKNRLEELQRLSESLDGKWGAMVKEAVAAATGTLAGIYGKVRKHPVSRMLRDDHVALNLSCTAYGMLYTTALFYGEEQIAAATLGYVNVLPGQIKRLSDLMPDVIVKELAADAPGNPEAASLARLAIDAAWQEQTNS